MMPRAASISSTMRRPSGNRKYSQIAWLMISAGKRWPAYGERAGVAIPLGYPAHSAPASPSARNLTVPLVDPFRLALLNTNVRSAILRALVEGYPHRRRAAGPPGGPAASAVAERGQPEGCIARPFSRRRHHLVVEAVGAVGGGQPHVAAVEVVFGTDRLIGAVRG